jgi:oligoribonuclease NrnB/cAMP/cGMP phosphodiesterase (DHH superfamily)
LLYIYGRDKYVDIILDQLELNDTMRFSETDFLLLSLEQEKIDNYIQLKQHQIIIKYMQTEYGLIKVGVIFAEQYISELGNTLAKNNFHLDFIMIINLPNAISFRTVDEEIDMSKIAQSFGGGGQQKAAGCEISDTCVKNIIEQLFAERVI